MASNFFNNKARAAAALAAKSSASNSQDSSDQQTQPWVEKYRPKTLDDVAAQDHTISVLQRNLHASNLPHMLFYGSPGTGKTSTILAMSKSLFGPALVRSRVLELNASDERGISIVREKIKDFARMHLSQPPADPAYRSQYPCPPFKIVILDEADSMTHDAQSALRRTMEKYSRITRFCLVCNYVTRIIDPVASRCSKFRFKVLDGSAARRRLVEIARMEKLDLEDNVVETLLRCSDGDLRKAITFMQSSARLARFGSGKKKEVSDETAEAKDTKNKITVKSIEEVSGMVPETVMDRVMAALRPNKRVSKYDEISNLVTDLVADGWSASQVLSQTYQAVLQDEAVSDVQKNQILKVCSEFDKRLVDGADEHLSTLDFMLQISGIIESN
ncbi:Subunit of heteropentameric Replication factor C (RF-C) [Microsporum audouinii]